MLSKRSDVRRIGLLLDHGQGLVKGTQPAAIVRAEDDSILPESVDQELERSRIHSGGVNQKVIEKNVRVALFTFRPFVLPKEAVEQEGKTAAPAADNDLQCGMAVE